VSLFAPASPKPNEKGSAWFAEVFIRAIGGSLNPFHGDYLFSIRVHSRLAKKFKLSALYRDGFPAVPP